MTPRPGKDTTGPKRGLSGFEDIDKVPRDPEADTKVQVLDTNKLEHPLRVVHHGDGHVSIVPTKDDGSIDDAALDVWAETRDGTKADELTKNVMGAVVDQKKVLRKEKGK